jgi:cyclopropane fatty-acyl-phospholipid synthase-like methyltransferase
MPEGTQPRSEERQAWIADRRAAVTAEYDALAATYDLDPYPNDPQQAWVRRLLAMCPAGGTVLDAPCGTGRYFPLVAEAGLTVVGVDQSANMLARARRRDVASELHHVGLQELTFTDRFDAVMTIDAMENVAPEDWPIVLANLTRSAHPGAPLYMTVEEDPGVDFAGVHRGLRAQGLPAVLGEVVDGDVAGYHYYPSREQVLEWISRAGLEVLDEGYEEEAGWGYRHLLLRRTT